MSKTALVEQIPRSQVKFWIFRLMSAKERTIEDLLSQLRTNQHWAENFDEMRTEVQDKVIDQMNKEMKEMAWYKVILKEATKTK